ncbi:MAG: hypothetical protein JST20_13835 [Bacteroidetes bacterium]|nr:hypothetical protein [Bacteroidota bacterium]
MNTIIGRILLLVCFSTVFAFQGCALFSCGTDGTLNLCEQILRNPDSLDSIALNNEIASFSEYQFELGLLKKKAVTH